MTDFETLLVHLDEFNIELMKANYLNCCFVGQLIATAVGGLFLFFTPFNVAFSDQPEVFEFTVHSHNDFQQEHPLWDALSLGYRSVEADVVDRRNQVRISHTGLLTQGTLKDLYLEPLQKIVNQKGSVYGDGKPFYLWIEIRPIFSTSDIVTFLRALLAQYPMLASFSSEGKIIRSGPVVAIICGYSGYKEDLFKNQTIFPGVLAGVDFDVDQPLKELGADKRFKWVALRWGKYIDWDGKDSISSAQLQKLKRLVSAVHKQGVKLRFFSNPQTKLFWEVVRELAVDQAGTDQLADVRSIVPEILFAKKSNLADFGIERELK